MIKINLLDGKNIDMEENSNGFEVAKKINDTLAKTSTHMSLNDEYVDLSTKIKHDSKIAFYTLDTKEGLDVARHTLTAQVLALAVKRLIPEAKLVIGPTIENGFYYDIDCAPISADFLPQIEKEMAKIIKTGAKVERAVWSIDDAINYFESQNEPHKAAIVKKAVHESKITEISVYIQKLDGKDIFVDLCRGPHTPSLTILKKMSYKLTNVAGAYLHGDSKNKMLNRIYGVAFANEEELAEHLNNLEEAAKRDHRRIGKEQDLYHFTDTAPGQVFWHHNGWTIYSELMQYMKEKVAKYDYTEVNSPQLMNLQFWQWSGHWDKYKDNMFVAEEPNGELYALKPMSCPGDVEIFNYGVVSYRDLPMRMAEFGKVFRRESAGSRHGLMRVQAFTQDDAHVFCTPEQLEDEVIKMCDLIKEVYADLGFSKIKVLFSTRPEHRIGSEEDWDRAEESLQKVCDRLEMPWELNEGDGAFYAPKLDFMITDAIGREWQCGTVQVDMNLPTRLKMEYIDADGSKKRPHMIHRAILGSVERFMGVMIENYAGRMPTWVSPTQVCIIPVADRHIEYANKILLELKSNRFDTCTKLLRAKVDDSSERMQKKILFAQMQQIPYMLVVGDKEVETNTVSVRLRDGTDLGSMPLANLIEKLKSEITNRI